MEHPASAEYKVKCEPEAAASKDTARPILCEPFLRGNHLYATDSYVLVRIPVKRDDNDTDGQVPRSALKAARTNRNFQHVLLEGDKAIALGKDGRYECSREQDGSDTWAIPFPSADALIPELNQLPVDVTLNVDNIVKVSKALGAKTLTFSLNPDSPLAPIRIEPRDHKDGRIGVVMPVRTPARPKP